MRHIFTLFKSLLILTGLVWVAMHFAVAEEHNLVSQRLETNYSVFQRCESPRPAICYLQVRPVCGVLKGDDKPRQVTYNNDCTACADPAVIGFKKGSCEG